MAMICKDENPMFSSMIFPARNLHLGWGISQLCLAEGIFIASLGEEQVQFTLHGLLQGAGGPFFSIAHGPSHGMP